MENNEENRNCYCSNTDMNCDYMPQGINAAFGYNTASVLMDDLNCQNIHEQCCSEEEKEMRAKMMKEIKCLSFAVVDIAEYLDTHPHDKKALCLHREYTNQLEKIKDKYQKIFGPLSIYYPCNKWRWLEEPWPWERSDFDVDL